MPALALDQASDCENPQLDIFISANGVPADLAELSFQIFDFTTDVDVQVYPATPDDREVVDIDTLCPAVGAGKIASGHYLASWTPPVDETPGPHHIKWYFKLTPSSSEQTFTEAFDVTGTATGSASATGESGYCTVQDLRDEGVTVNDASDDRLRMLIRLATVFIDKSTGQWFEPRACTLLLDGEGSPTLFLDVPIIAISSISVDDNVIDNPDDYRVYNRHITQRISLPDDRGNPRITWAENTRLHVYPYGRSPEPQRRNWGIGTQNISVTGVFGYTDFQDGVPYGVTPPMIREVCMQLVMRKLPTMGGSGAEDRLELQQRSRLTSERTRDQSYSYGAPRPGGGAGLFTGNSEIDDVLMAYQSPMRIRTT